MKKGMIFTWDVVFSVIVAIVIVFIAFQFSSESIENYSELVSAKRTASDIIAALDYTNILNDTNRTYIEQELNATLPLNIDMSITNMHYDTDFADTVPEKIFVRENLTENYRKGKWIFPRFYGGGQSIFRLVLVEYSVGFK